MECSDNFIVFRNSAVHNMAGASVVADAAKAAREASDAAGGGHEARNAQAHHYSWSNFAYGQIYYTGFGRLFQRFELQHEHEPRILSQEQ